MEQTDVVVVGAGLAGLTAALEVAQAGRSVLLLDQEGEQSLGGQAFWSLGGLFLVDSPEQRRMGIRDSYELAWQDWLGTAGFDRPQDHWPRLWAQAYVAFAAGEKRHWLRQFGIRSFPVVGWAERGGYGASGPGNSVPRFHITWGTGPAVIGPFVERVQSHPGIRFLGRHQVRELVKSGGNVTGVRGVRLENSTSQRGQPSSRRVVGDFEIQAQAVIITSGGIGANFELVRQNWPERLGQPPKSMVAGVPDYVDGRMLGVSEQAGASLIHKDRMWHYCEGLQNWNPIWTHHGIRILPGPSSLWLDARGQRLTCFPGFDTLGSLQQIMQSGYDYSWFILTQKVIEKEFALSGSEQNPDLTGKSLWRLLSRVLPGAPPPVEAFKKKGADFVVRRTIQDLVAAMNSLTPEPLLDPAAVQKLVEERDRQLDNPFCKDMQIVALRGARQYLGDRLMRSAPPHRFLDPRHGPLIAVRLNILTRKTLGGLETDLDARVLTPGGPPLPGLYAAGEVAGFGGGGMHGYRALEGTFLGGCLFSGRTAGRSAARAIL